MNREKTESWKTSTPRTGFPSGTCSDATILESTIQTVWYDEAARLVRLRRVTRVQSPNMRTREFECLQQKHPVSTDEVRQWILHSGFMIKHEYGDYAKGPVTRESPRAIFWAEKG